MIDELDELGYDMGIDTDESFSDEDWTRPEEYPDPTVLDLTDLDGVYLTYDLTKTPGYGWIGIYVLNTVASTPIYFERGHITNNEFIVDETFTGTHASTSTGYCFRQALDPENGDVQLWRVRSNDQIKRIAFVTNSTVSL